MNKLSYGLLSFLSTEAQTGYDLMRKLNQFWHTNHSAIYPLLSELEEKGYVAYKLIEQCGKPDKKLYSLTAHGLEALKEWIKSATDAAVVKDEMVLKFLCMQVLEKETVETLLAQMETRYLQELDYYSKSMEKVRNAANGKTGAYLLLQKKLAEIQLGVRWCRWVRSLYEENGDINFLDKDFTDSY